MEPTEVPTTGATTQAGPASPDAPAILHGRLLNVSRMATIGEMAAGVAHELNQPLTAIANYAHACNRLLASANADPDDLREALRQIAFQTARAADIIRRLRALARSNQGERLPAQLNTLISELQDLLETDARVHDVQLSLELAPELPEVLVDAPQIQQVILNFVRNSVEALEHRPNGGRHISIRTSVQPGGNVEVTVMDSGPGMPADVAKQIFDPFFSTKENGTGLGLAISNSIARAHGGSVGYRANTPTGACFYMLLPACTAE
jgi:two-component system sensor kinase FixL